MIGSHCAGVAGIGGEGGGGDGGGVGGGGLGGGGDGGGVGGGEGGGTGGGEGGGLGGEGGSIPHRQMRSETSESHSTREERLVLKSYCPLRSASYEQPGGNSVLEKTFSDHPKCPAFVLHSNSVKCATQFEFCLIASGWIGGGVGGGGLGGLGGEGGGIVSHTKTSEDTQKVELDVAFPLGLLQRRRLPFALR